MTSDTDDVEAMNDTMKLAVAAFERVSRENAKLREALTKLDRLRRGLDTWHEDAEADAWIKARVALGDRTDEPAV